MCCDKERVRMTFSHKEPDKVPIFEILVANPVLESVLGRKITEVGTGEGKVATIKAVMKGREVWKAFTRENIEAILEMYSKVGFDMFRFNPEEKENIIFLGPPGVGKTHLAIALGACGIEAGLSVYFTRLHDMIHTLAQA